MTKVSAAIRDFRDHWRSLKVQWETTSELWQDSVRDRFEREFWEELKIQADEQSTE